MENISSKQAPKKALRKTDVISSCDCLVGFLSGEKVSKSDIDYEVKRISDIQPKFKEYGLLNGEPLSPKQIVDNRRGYLSRFVYCPYCGEKVNWKQVLSNCL
jgi:translation initiation factor 2 beta subunit (eIF-2beta)/eIF-5